MLGKISGSAKLYRLGSLRWLKENGVPVPAEEPFIRKWGAQGATIIALSNESQLLALFALRDQPKKHAREAIQNLQRRSLQVHMVTGDSRATAEAIASQTSIPSQNVHAEARPEDKVEVIRRLQAAGERVAFVGDGINDAPALEQADLGIALMNASDIARESADIVLLNAEMDAIPEAIALSQATLRTIKQNLFWAFFYNAAGIPLAALGFLNPILCALAMGFSDLIVVGNALRLRFWRR